MQTDLTVTTPADAQYAPVQRKKTLLKKMDEDIAAGVEKENEDTDSEAPLGGGPAPWSIQAQEQRQAKPKAFMIRVPDEDTIALAELAKSEMKAAGIREQELRFSPAWAPKKITNGDAVKHALQSYICLLRVLNARRLGYKDENETEPGPVRDLIALCKPPTPATSSKPRKQSQKPRAGSGAKKTNPVNKPKPRKRK